MVAFTNLVVALVATALAVEAAPIDTNNIEKRAGGCSSYVIINTRGTGEMQGQSSGFRTMNRKVMASKSGGSIYNTVYSAGITQMSGKGTADIVRKVSSTLSSNPNTCFILEGYSQGAAATTNALPKLTGKNFDAVKGVFLIGNPMHHKGKACNVDTKGGKSTLNVNGMSAALGGIPENWVSKTMDVCNYGDGVCDTSHGFGINMQHLAYPASSSTQSMGSEFILKQLNGASATTAEADCTEAAPAAGSSAAGSSATGSSAADYPATGSSATGSSAAAGASAAGSSAADTAASTTTKRQLSKLSGMMGGGGSGGGSSRLDKLKSMFGGGGGASSESSDSESTEASGGSESSGTAAKACTAPAASTESSGTDTASSDTGADASADSGADAGGGSRLDKLKSMFGGGGGSGGGMAGRLSALRGGGMGGGLSKLRGGGMGGGLGGLSKLRGMGGA